MGDVERSRTVYVYACGMQVGSYVRNSVRNIINSSFCFRSSSWFELNTLALVNCKQNGSVVDLYLFRR